MPVCQIPLTQGRFAICDAADAEAVLRHRWHVAKSGKTFYAATTVKNKRVTMHALLLPEADEVDHKNRNGLDNRRENIRPCTRSQNAANCPRPIGQSGYRGVYRKYNGYRAQIKVNGVKYYLGRYDTAEEAAFWYDLAAMSAFGGFATLNF